MRCGYVATNFLGFWKQTTYAKTRGIVPSSTGTTIQNSGLIFITRLGGGDLNVEGT
jgi:hypothetical protein